MTEPVYKVEACRSCQAPIIWAVSTATRKPMPVDEAVTPDGNVEICVRLGNQVIATVHPVGGLFPATDQPLRKSHFATCPQADEWRKG